MTPPRDSRSKGGNGNDGTSRDLPSPRSPSLRPLSGFRVAPHARSAAFARFGAARLSRKPDRGAPLPCARPAAIRAGRTDRSRSTAAQPPPGASARCTALPIQGGMKATAGSLIPAPGIRPPGQPGPGHPRPPESGRADHGKYPSRRRRSPGLARRTPHSPGRVRTAVFRFRSRFSAALRADDPLSPATKREGRPACRQSRDRGMGREAPSP